MDGTAPDGTLTGIQFSTTRPRQVLGIGDQAEFAAEHGTDVEQAEAFELYRRSMPTTDAPARCQA